MSTISMRATDVRSKQPYWILGGPTESGFTDRTAINLDPQAKSVYTVVVDTAANSTVYTITVGATGNTATLTYTSDASATKVEIAAGLVAAIDASPIARGQCSAVSDGVDTVTVTANLPNIEVVVSDSDANLTSAQVTAADGADAIGFARGVIRTGHQGSNELCALAASSKLAAQVITATPSGFVTGSILTCAVYEIRGSERHHLATVSETSATSLDATLDAIVVSLNAALPANSVLAASTPATATSLTFTAEIAGLEIEVECGADDSGASVPTWTLANTTGPSEATSIHRALLGATMRASDSPAPTIGGTETQYAGNSALAYMARGGLAVASSQTIAAGETVYIELGVSADNGKFYNTSSATRIALARDRATWELDADTNTGSLAALSLK